MGSSTPSGSDPGRVDMGNQAEWSDLLATGPSGGLAPRLQHHGTILAVETRFKRLRAHREPAAGVDSGRHGAMQIKRHQKAESLGPVQPPAPEPCLPQGVWNPPPSNP